MSTVTQARPLRGRDELEKILAASISLGAIKSVEDAVKAGDEDALEYAAQQLSDASRLRVSEKKELPIHLIHHLFKDRHVGIKTAMITGHYDKLTPEMQETAKREVIAGLISTHRDSRGYSRGDSDFHSWSACAHRLTRRFFSEKDDAQTAKFLQAIVDAKDYRGGMVDGQEIRLRTMPKTFEIIYNQMSYGKVILDLIHPNDEELRMTTVKKALGYTVPNLRSHFTSISESNGREHIKVQIHKLIASDPDKRIRSLLIDKCPTVTTLQWIAENDPDSTIRFHALTKAAKMAKRAAYSKAYHDKKRGY